MQMVSTTQSAHSRLLWSGCSHQAPVRHFSTEKDTARVEEPTENEKKLTVEVEELRKEATELTEKVKSLDVRMCWAL